MARRNNMKKTLSLLVISLFIVSCGGNNNSSDVKPTPQGPDYIIDEETYNYEINRDTVLFRSNYTVDMFNNGSHYMTSYIDYGRFRTDINGNVSWYELIEDGNNVIYTYFSLYIGGHKETSTRTKEEIYSFFFMDSGFMFDLPYSSLTLDEENKRYDISNVTLGDKHITGGYFIAKNKKPLEMEMIIENAGVFHASFTKHGTTHFDFPEVQEDRIESVTKVFTAKESSGFSGDIEDIFTLKTSRFGFDHNVTYSITKINENKIQIVLNNILPSDLRYFISYMGDNGDVRLYNAHDHGVEIDYSIYADFPYNSNPILYLPFDIEDETCSNMYNETKNDKENNNTRYGELVNEEESLYSYSFYLWTNFDESACRFENISSENDHLLIKLDIDRINPQAIRGDERKYLSTETMIDVDGDGSYDWVDQQYTLGFLNNLSRLVKMEDHHCVFVTE